MRSLTLSSRNREGYWSMGKQGTECAPIDSKYREWLEFTKLPDTEAHHRMFYKEYIEGIVDRVMSPFLESVSDGESALEAKLDVELNDTIAKFVALRRKYWKPDQ